MARKGPGKAHRQGLTVIELFKMFPDDATAEQWFEEQRWPDGRFCPDCGSTNTVAVKNRKPMPYRCRDCRGHFSVRKGTVMQSSKVGFQKWAIALYMMTTGLKGTSSMKVYRELGIRQGTAWFLMQRIREGFAEGSGKPFPGPVEVDETYFGGERRNMSKTKRKAMNKSRGPVGKTAVVGMKDRDSNEVRAEVVHRTDGATLQGFVREHTEPGAAVYTDDAAAYRGMPEFDHEAVNHTVSEYVRGQAHTNGIESFWAMLKRAHKGTFHKISPKHLDRYVNEFSGRHNVPDRDTVDQMAGLARGMVGKRLTYRELVSE
ncbi:MAG: IS1595 family transposase [Defluviicoccus sp.]|nr:IS1595 family transposase [Defluviicoccus sp.]